MSKENEIDENFAKIVFYTEKELGYFITPNFPLLKMLIGAELLGEHLEKEAKAYRR